MIGGKMTIGRIGAGFFIVGLLAGGITTAVSSIAHGNSHARSDSAAERIVVAQADNGTAEAAAGDPRYRSLEGDPAAIEEGQRTFHIHCGECHGVGGRGALGPNFTDDVTLHGDRYEDMVNVVTNGVRGRPMRSWIKKLGPVRIREVVAYVYSLKGSRSGGETPFSLPERGIGSPADTPGSIE